jgi:hypothetical protein
MLAILENPWSRRRPETGQVRLVRSRLGSWALLYFGLSLRLHRQ